MAELVPSEASSSPDDGGLDEILSKLNIEVTPTLILTGFGAFIALWILSSVVAAVDSVPLTAPKIAGINRNCLHNLVHRTVSPFQGKQR
ncbi:Protein CURVATURE THYLAKOID 1D chloroplastic [Zea mays]|uniref:Protein CURVATURE THYLAKOID 1D chloroplastic n=1 Tax=Zea mays TaxID=4577 RepID=A0A1D6HKY8_MAIZE|nr:Protein CURVATURE THYLAKOID 1D chloroplastic [Zea mays]